MKRRAFTLIEVLVVIGLIAALAALLLPAVNAARKSASRARQRIDLESIATALEAYKADFGDYPRVDQDNMGSAILGLALVGPGPDVIANAPVWSSSNAYKMGDFVTNAAVPLIAIADPPQGVDPASAGGMSYWTQPLRSIADFVSGPGFRMQDGGKIYPSYLPADKFRMRGASILDIYDKPILYFPAAPGKPNIGVTTNPPTGPVAGYVDRSEFAYYDANDNFLAFKRKPPTVTDVADDADALTRIRLLLGDVVGDAATPTVPNGTIEGVEHAACTGPFLLWSAGPDGIYGPDMKAAPPTNELSGPDAPKCDDVTNFR